MKRLILATTVLGALAAATPAFAGNVAWGVSIGLGGGGFAGAVSVGSPGVMAAPICAPAPCAPVGVAVACAPVCAPPVYYAPAPRWVYAPAPVVYAPAPVAYAAPVPVGVYRTVVAVAPRPMAYPGYGYRPVAVPYHHGGYRGHW
jgi:2-oxoglutarate dehydrogenase E2 component (dihydrolipoamide succinyltransferase)